MTKERPLPVIIACDQRDGNWMTRVALPSAEGFIHDSYTECIRDAAKEAGLKRPDITDSDSLTDMILQMPGNVKSWKDASRRHEVFTWELGSQFKKCPLNLLGIRVKMTKMMDLVPPTNPVEVDLPSHSGEGKRGTSTEELTTL